MEPYNFATPIVTPRVFCERLLDITIWFYWSWRWDSNPRPADYKLCTWFLIAWFNYIYNTRSPLLLAYNTQQWLTHPRKIYARSAEILEHCLNVLYSLLKRFSKKMAATEKVQQAYFESYLSIYINTLHICESNSNRI